MPDHSSDATGTVDSTSSLDELLAAVEPPGETTRSSKRKVRTDWRLGGRTVFRWREGLLAVALISLGAAVLAGAALETLWRSPWTEASATALLWIGMLVPVVWAFSRSRPVGLLRLRPLDLLYGLVLGAVLRTAQGWLAGFDGQLADFPSYTLIDGSLPALWMLTDLVGPVVVAPAIEELFFRGVLLVALYTVLRRPFGKLTAGLCAVLASTALFVVFHALSGSLGTGQVIALTLLGGTCGLLVVLTGRIWGALLVHGVYNATFVALALVGTFLG